MDSRNLRKLALLLGVIVLVFLYYRLHWQTLQNYVDAMDHCERLFCDFYKVFYRMGETVFIERVPYKGFYYSPFAALIFNLWGRLPRTDALTAWGVTQVIAVIGLFFYWQPALQKKNFSFQLSYLFILLTAFPLLHNFKWGQVSVFLLLAVFLAMHAHGTNKPILAAFWLAFAASIKFYPAIFLLYFIFRRDLKFLTAFGLFAFLFGILIPALFIGWRETAVFYVQILNGAESRFILDGGTGPLNSQSAALVVLRLIHADAGGTAFKVVQALGYAVVIANIVLTFLVVESDLEHRVVWAFLLLSVSIPFFVPTSWPHYFVYLPAFQACLLFIMNKDKSVLLKYLLLFLSIVLANIIFFNVIANRQTYVGAGFLFWSNLSLLILAYIELLPRVKPTDGITFLKRIRLSL